MFWYGNLGRTVYNSWEYGINNSGANGNYRSGLLADSWTPENPNNDYPKAVYGRLIIPYTDRYLQNGSFLRLGSLQLGYTFNSPFIQQKLGIEHLRLYINSENLLTITEYSGWDVDFKGSLPFGYGYDGNTYPLAKSLQFGAQLTF